MTGNELLEAAMTAHRAVADYTSCRIRIGEQAWDDMAGLFTEVDLPPIPAAVATLYGVRVIVDPEFIPLAWRTERWDGTRIESGRFEAAR